MKHLPGVHARRPGVHGIVPIPTISILPLTLLLLAGCGSTPPVEEPGAGDGTRAGTAGIERSSPARPLFEALEPEASPWTPRPGAGEGAGLARPGEEMSSGRAAGRVSPAVEVVRTGPAASVAAAAADEIPPSSSPPVRGDPLLRRLRLILTRLEAFEGREERSLDDGERLMKHQLEIQLMALHFLVAGDTLEHLDPLLGSLHEPREPGTVHTLLRAAFYHAVDREDLSMRALDGIRPGRGEASFAVHDLTACREVRGYRDFTPAAGGAVQPDELVYLYMELEHLCNEPVGGSFRRAVKVDLFLYDSSDRLRDQRSHAPAPEVGPTSKEENILTCPYRIPLRLEPAEYRVVALVTDLGVKRTARAEMVLRVVR
ncbi:MAG: hypothetical protein ACE5GW_03230 [Planctomycetota bacterium]